MCGVVSLVTNSLVRTFSRVCQVISQLFARWTASTLRECSSTNATTDVLPAWEERQLISVRLSGSIWIINSQTDGLVGAVHKIGHHSHLIWTHQITTCGVTWKLWCMHKSWTQETNYSSKFSALQEASTILQCFVRLHVLWSHESENVSKQTEDTLNNLLECWRICNSTFNNISQ